MIQKRKIVTIHLIFYVLILFFIFVGLILNISTVRLNEEISGIQRELKKINQENRVLGLEVMEKKSYKKLELMAKDKLGLVPVRKITYINKELDE